MDTYGAFVLGPWGIGIGAVIGLIAGIIFFIKMDVDERERGTFVHFLSYILFPIGGAVIGGALLPVLWPSIIFGYVLYGIYLLFKKFGWEG